jgi:hypothetical protein
MASEFVVALVSLVFVAVPLALLFYGIGRTARRTAEAGSSLFGALGVLVVVIGLIALLWTQLNFDHRLVHDPGASRWDVATGPLVVIALGLLVCIAAQMLRVMQERFARDADERSRGTRV